MLNHGEKLEIEGNASIYFIFSVCNICLLVLGLTIIGISIYLMLLTSGINTFDMLLIFLGILLLGNAIFGFKVRISIRWSFIYSLIVTSLFVFDIFLTFSVVDNTETILNWVIEDKEKNLSSSIDQVKQAVRRNINIMDNLLWLVSFLLVKEVFI
jgi:hypothetical protein